MPSFPDNGYEKSVLILRLHVHHNNFILHRVSITVEKILLVNNVNIFLVAVAKKWLFFKASTPENNQYPCSMKSMLYPKFHAFTTFLAIMALICIHHPHSCLREKLIPQNVLDILFQLQIGCAIMN